MPQINAYQDQVTAQGTLVGQANPNDFGAGIGEAMGNISNQLNRAADKVEDQIVAQDVTNVHVNMAKARAEWTQNLQERERTATPGDDTFAPKLMKDMDEWMQKASDSVQTRKGKQIYATLAANMTSEFGQRAINIQADLSARDAVNKYQLLATSSGTAVYNDPTQYAATLAQAKAAIDDPNGMFGKIPVTARDQFKQRIEQDINFAAARGYVRNNPEGLLASVAPGQLEQFKPFETVLKANTAPGGQLKVSKEMMVHAPVVLAAAATYNVNPNVLMAQGDQESRGNAAAVSSAGAQGVFQFMPATAAQYGVDVKDVKSSARGAAKYMSDLLNTYGGDYNKALAAYNWGPGNLNKAMQNWGADWLKHAPQETQDYVATIMQNSGAVASDAPAVAEAKAAPVLEEPKVEAPKAPVASSLPFFKNLSWEQQDQVVKEAVQLQHMKMTMAEKARMEAEHAQKKAQEGVMDGLLKRIVDQGPASVSDHEIVSDQTLRWDQKQHMVDYKMTRQRELLAGAESKTNPAEVRRLMLMIHAPDNDPSKTYNMDPIMESYRNGGISTNEMRMLRGEVEQLRSGDGSAFTKRVNMASEVVHQTFMKSLDMLGPQMTGQVAEAWYRFRMDMEDKIAAKRAKNEDPTVLLDPSSREYLLSPERIKSFVNGRQVMGQAAGQMLNGMVAAHQTAQPAAPAPVFVVGKTYKVNGEMQTYLGGPTNLSTSWSK